MIRAVAINIYTPGFTTSPDTYTVMLDVGATSVIALPDPGAAELVAIVDVANGIVASGGGGGTRTTHQTPTTIASNPKADAKMRLKPIQ